VLRNPTCRAPGVPGQSLILAWRLAGSGTADLSADTPGIPGTLRRDLPSDGTLEIRFGCLGLPGTSETHVFDLYAVGGTATATRLTVSAVIPAGGLSGLSGGPWPSGTPSPSGPSGLSGFSAFWGGSPGSGGWHQ